MGRMGQVARLFPGLVQSVLIIVAAAGLFTGLAGIKAYGNESAGTERWRFEMDGGALAPAAIGDNGVIYAGSDADSFYAVWPDGTVKWRFPAGYAVRSSPTIAADGSVYAGLWDSFLWSLNPRNTLEIQNWRFQTEGRIESSPAIGKDGVVYIGTSDGILYAVDKDGEEKWRFLAGGGIVSSLAVGKDWTVYAGAGDHFLYAVDVEGEQRWRFSTGGAVRSSPAMGENDAVYCGSDDGRLYAVDVQGDEKWRFSTGGAVRSSPAVGPDGAVYFGSDDGHLYAVDAEGEEKWRFPTDGAVRSSPAVGADGAIYFGSSDGHLYAVNADGDEKWHFLTGGPIESAPAIQADGTIYVGSMDGYLYALNSDSGGAAASVWPMFQQNSRRTGLHPSPEFPTEGSIRISIAPAGATVEGAQWRRVDTTEWFDSGATEEDVPEGGHEIEFKEIDGWTVPGNIHVTVVGEELSEATGTYELVGYILTYRAVRGGYIDGDTSQTVLRGQDGEAVEAIPRTGFYFVEWSDGATDNPRIDRNVMGDITVTARFASAEGRPGTPDEPFVVSNPEQLSGMRENLSSYFRLAEDIDMEEVDGWEPVGTEEAPFTGGLIGDGHKISNLFVDTPDMDNAGLFGYAENAIIENMGLEDANIEGRNNVGGLVGYAFNVIIEESYVKGFVSGADHVGGLVGYLEYSAASTIINSYADCDVNGDSAVGGVVGKLGADAAIKNVYAVGRVSGSGDIGGLVGRNDDGSHANVTSSYWDADTGPETSAGGKGETNAFMMWEETFPEWDFDEVWSIDEGVGYPYLRWEADPHVRKDGGSTTCFIGAL